MAGKSGNVLRCAIYTRKSTEHGLELEFNSLDAQREACEAYIKSQASEGWRVLPARYDDPAYSGGNLDRPALQHLLKDLHAGAIDIVVVYKIDRLTRSLTDFAKLVEIFEANDVSFVAITQQFNTTTSMGRLTLNVLLSFAQFERELASERVRDKLAASRQKGKWTGGSVPLGYDSKDKRLIINQAEARTVRLIFDRYLALGSYRKLIAELDAHGVLTKKRPVAGKVVIAAVVKDQTFEQRPALVAPFAASDAVRLDQSLDFVESLTIDDRRMLAGKRPAVIASFADIGAVLEEIGERAIGERNTAPDPKFARDLLVHQTRRDQAKYLLFTVGQCFEAGTRLENRALSDATVTIALERQLNRVEKILFAEWFY
jgi:DNA invertase Pin-like site-specific DNA recombinase